MRDKLITATFFITIFLFLTIPVSSIFAQSKGGILKLDQLIEEALSNNPELKAARERADAYREQTPGRWRQPA